MSVKQWKGKSLAATDVEQTSCPERSFQEPLLRLLAEDEKCWVKLCSFYRLSQSGPPDYADMAPLARALVAACPDRLVWGSNWPHPALEGPMPNDGDLLDLMLDWVPDEAVRNRILADNPARLFGFGPPATAG